MTVLDPNIPLNNAQLASFDDTQVIELRGWLAAAYGDGNPAGPPNKGGFAKDLLQDGPHAGYIPHLPNARSFRDPFRASFTVEKLIRYLVDVVYPLIKFDPTVVSEPVLPEKAESAAAPPAVPASSAPESAQMDVEDYINERTPASEKVVRAESPSAQPAEEVAAEPAQEAAVKPAQEAAVKPASADFQKMFETLRTQQEHMLEHLRQQEKVEAASKEEVNILLRAYFRQAEDHLAAFVRGELEARDELMRVVYSRTSTALQLLAEISSPGMSSVVEEILGQLPPVTMVRSMSVGGEDVPSTDAPSAETPTEEAADPPAAPDEPSAEGSDFSNLGKLADVSPAASPTWAELRASLVADREVRGKVARVLKEEGFPCDARRMADVLRAAEEYLRTMNGGEALEA